jgi:hypothetical protein
MRYAPQDALHLDESAQLGRVGSPRKGANTNESFADPFLQFPQWQNSVLQAVMETNHQNLRRKIEVSKQAIHERLSESEISKAEGVALCDALSTLRVLSDVLSKSASTGT